jgi:hypothetical protein
VIVVVAIAASFEQGAAVTGRTYHLRYGAVPLSDVSNQQFLIAFLLAALAGTAVFFHAERHKIKHPSAWASFVFLFLIVGLPSYALHVRRVRRTRSRR